MAARLAILVKRFPKLSETFVAGEIAELLRQGVELRIFSMYRPNEGMTQTTSQALLSRVTYLDEVGCREADRTLASSLACHGIDPVLLKHELTENTATLGELGSLIYLSQKLNITHLHAHYLSGPATLADYASRLGDTTFSVSAHAKDIYLTPPVHVLRRLEQACFVATCTSHNVANLQALSPKLAHKVHRIYHGVDAQYFCPASRVDARAKQQPEILSVGRFRHKKGFDLLIRACARLLDQGTEFRCKIVGYGEEAASLSALIDEYNLREHVELIPPINHSDVKKMMHEARVFVLPCRVSADGDRDGIPNVMLEAMACRVPVVSTSISGIPEVVETGSNGILVAPEDPVALAEAIACIFASAPLAKELSAQARNTVMESFDWTKNVGKLAELLRPAVDKSSPRLAG